MCSFVLHTSGVPVATDGKVIHLSFLSVGCRLPVGQLSASGSPNFEWGHTLPLPTFTITGILITDCCQKSKLEKIFRFYGVVNVSIGHFTLSVPKTEHLFSLKI